MFSVQLLELLKQHNNQFQRAIFTITQTAATQYKFVVCCMYARRLLNLVFHVLSKAIQKFRKKFQEFLLSLLLKRAQCVDAHFPVNKVEKMFPVKKACLSIIISTLPVGKEAEVTVTVTKYIVLVAHSMFYYHGYVMYLLKLKYIRVLLQHFNFFKNFFIPLPTVPCQHFLFCKM